MQRHDSETKKKAKTKDVESMWAEEWRDYKIQRSQRREGRWAGKHRESIRFMYRVMNKRERYGRDKGWHERETEMRKTEKGNTGVRKHACQLAHQQIDLCLFTVSITEHDTLLVWICHYWESPSFQPARNPYCTKSPLLFMISIHSQPITLLLSDW